MLGQGAEVNYWTKLCFSTLIVYFWNIKGANLISSNAVFWYSVILMTVTFSSIVNKFITIKFSILCSFCLPLKMCIETSFLATFYHLKTAGTQAGEEIPVVSRNNIKEYKDSFSNEKFDFRNNPNITFFVYVSNFTWPIKIQVGTINVNYLKALCCFSQAMGQLSVVQAEPALSIPTAKGFWCLWLRAGRLLSPVGLRTHCEMRWDAGLLTGLRSNEGSYLKRVELIGRRLTKPKTKPGMRRQRKCS